MSSLNGQFEEMIKFVDQELTNLKTAHYRPLGALDFFHMNKIVSVSLSDPYGIGYYYADFWIDVTVKLPDIKPPIVQTGWSIPSGFSRMDLYEYSVSSDYSVWSYKLSLSSSSIQSASFMVSAVSSIPLISINVRS